MSDKLRDLDRSSFSDMRSKRANGKMVNTACYNLE